MFALFTQLLPWNGEGRDVSSFEAMYIAPHPKEAAVKLVKKVHKEPVEGASERHVCEKNTRVGLI
jgi:hypothetical protein